ncbi:MAG TPA: Na/Pi cotransporter family protein [bacterium]|nr:Na/Pi cotransporter family protein [bacterium]
MMALNLAVLRKKLIGLSVLVIAFCVLWLTGIGAGLWHLRSAIDPVPLVFGILGGLGLFIFGIQIMSDSLQKAAGTRLRHILEMLTGGPIRGVLVGAGVTAIIQSSSATTVMLVGFVNAGLLTLVQAIGVVLGANIGTTVTAQLVAFKISHYALPAIAIGMAITMASRQRARSRLWGQVVLGFGVLFYGLTTMVAALKPLQGSDQFREFFVQFGTTPLLGILAGAMLTAVVQSSSATVGLVIALGTTGLIDFGTALPLLLGDNVGTTVTALLSSIGTGRMAKRTALAHCFFNVIGVAWALAVLPYFAKLVDFITAGDANSPATIARHIANAHTMFNVLNTLAVLPFIKQLARLVTWVLPDKAAPPSRSKVGDFLQEQFLKSPPVAIAQVKKAILHMFERAYQMLDLVRKMLWEESTRFKPEVLKFEDELDRHQAEITEYISRVMHKGVSIVDSEVLTKMLHAVNDVENIGDRLENTSVLLERLENLGQSFSRPGKEDIIEMTDTVLAMGQDSLNALELESRQLTVAAIEKEDKIDEMKRVLRKRNRDRYVAFRRGENETEEKLWGQVISNDIISNMEKIADHVVNVLEAFDLVDE